MTKLKINDITLSGGGYMNCMDSESGDSPRQSER